MGILIFPKKLAGSIYKPDKPEILLGDFRFVLAHRVGIFRGHAEESGDLPLIDRH
jgi:hypothetical protein